MAIGPVKNYVDFDFSSVTRKQTGDVNIASKSSESVVSNKQADNVSEQVQAVKVVSPKPEVEYNFNLKRGNAMSLFEASDKSEESKRIPDVKKDAILDQYKFFVNTSGVNNSDGVVRRISE